MAEVDSQQSHHQNMIKTNQIIPEAPLTHHKMPQQYLTTSIFEYAHFNPTIEADVQTNRQFLNTHFKITALLLIVILILKLLPAPLIINIVENDPTTFTKQLCTDDDCSDNQQGFEIITIKKINPFQRQLKYFVKLNRKQMDVFKYQFSTERLDLFHQITWIEIYAARNNAIYGDVVYEKSGQDAYEIIFNQEPLIYVGEVHILSEVSYLIRIYKQIWTYNTTVPRQLQEDIHSNYTEYTDYTDYTNNTNNTDYTANINDTILEPSGNQTSQKNESIIPENQVPTQNPPIPVQPVQPPQPQYQTITKQISAPLTVSIVRYSEFFTGAQLLIRYVTFLYILYVRADTMGCPTIFHYILFFTANPLIFTEIAFPNIGSNVLSTMCSSMYILYAGIFLNYTHQPGYNKNVDMIVRVLKAIGILALYIAGIFRQMHLVNQIYIEFVLYSLIILLMVPLLKYIWNIYFFREKTIHHRSLLFIILTIYYLLFLFFSGYLVDYGWKKISFYLIIMAYGVNLCYLTRPHRYLSQQKKQPHLNSSKNQEFPSTPPKPTHSLETQQRQQRMISETDHYNQQNLSSLVKVI